MSQARPDVTRPYAAHWGAIKKGKGRGVDWKKPKRNDILEPGGDKMHKFKWNFQHIVKLKTKRAVKMYAIKEGYKEFEITTPEEVVDHED